MKTPVKLSLLLLLTSCMSDKFSVENRDAIILPGEVFTLPACLSDWPLAILDTPTLSNAVEIFEVSTIDSVCYPTLVSVTTSIDIDSNPDIK